MPIIKQLVSYLCMGKYDDLIKNYAEKINWDWRLLAALIYQESRFEPEATSWAEAKGLMQLMPETAEQLNVLDRLSPESSIKGGTKYMKQLWNQFEKVEDSILDVPHSSAKVYRAIVMDSAGNSVKTLRAFGAQKTYFYVTPKLQLLKC